MKNLVLLVGADLGKNVSLHRELEARSFEITISKCGDDGLVQALKQKIDLVASDIRMPGLSGFELVSRVRERKPRLPIILTSSFDTADNAIQAAKLGVYKYVRKPFEPADFAGLISQALQSSRRAAIPADVLGTEGGRAGLIGSAPVMQVLYDKIGQAASDEMTVLIRGATGTGKELVARAIHEHSDRARQPFLPVNCSALPSNLFESELFGHERGAFTGASSQRIGRFESANRGTIFLDEIGDLDLAMQVKLLRVLQEKKIERVGSNEEIEVDVRIIAATNRNLDCSITEGKFRQDLFYRLNAFPIRTPELGTHTEDIPQLAEHFINHCKAQQDPTAPCIEKEATEFLQGRAWPGNVRQLQNVIQHAVLLARDDIISLAHVRVAYRDMEKPATDAGFNPNNYAELFAKVSAGQTRGVLRKVVEQTKRSWADAALKFCNGNRSKAAKSLGIGRATLKQLLRPKLDEEAF